jgi:outer membrane receptor protein involved in Fe transport
VNNYLDTVIETTINAGEICDELGPFRALVAECAAVAPGTPIPYTFPTDAVGNIDLEAEKIRMIDVGYMGIWRNVTFNASIYESNTKDVIDFFPSVVYTSDDPPPGWFFGGLPSPPFPDILEELQLPSEYTYRNVAEVRQRGLDLSLDWQVTPVWSTFVSYSYMDDPKVSQVEGDDTFGINIPPSNRFNIGFAYAGRGVRASLNANYTSRAFWSDVLDSRFWGETDPYLMLNGNLSFDLVQDKVILTIKGTNLSDQEIQQHIFGDFIGRRIITQLQYRF